MQDWTSVKPIKEYQVDIVTDQQSAIGVLFDNMFGWIDAGDRYVTIESQRDQMLVDSPDLDIRRLDAGYQLEAERLNAIQQQSSKGFQIIDINPGLLLSTENPLTLPYEFIFDGTNFLPDQNMNFVKNFRSVNIPIAGNFLKIEYIFEINTGANISYSPIEAVGDPTRLVPQAQVKYSEAFGTSLGEMDLITDQEYYTLDNFARNKVWLDFGPSTGKPHLIPTSGRIFKTYFNEVNVSLNIGAPKIRVTIGFNSEVYEASSSGAVNSRLALSGAGRLFNDIDQVLSPFCLNDLEFTQGVSRVYRGIPCVGAGVPAQASYNILANYGYIPQGATTDLQSSYGYSVIFISRIRFCFTFTTALTVGQYVRANLNIKNMFYPTIGIQTQTKTVHNFKVSTINSSEYILEPSEPIRVVIPASSALYLTIDQDFTAAMIGNFSYSIDGYSLGEIVRTTLPSGYILAVTSKFITDATFISDLNRIRSLTAGA